MADVMYKGRTTGTLYRFMFETMPTDFPQYLDPSSGMPLLRITINGEQATNCSATAGATLGSVGIRDGSVARGVLAGSDDPYKPGWLQSDWEKP